SVSVTIRDSSTFLSISASAVDAIEPNGPPGAPARNTFFQIGRYDDVGNYPELRVLYQMSGAAQNGVDYALLSGSVTLAANEYSTNIEIAPLGDDLPEAVENVVMTLAPSNTYLLQAVSSAATCHVLDTSTTVSIVSLQDAVK